VGQGGSGVAAMRKQLGGDGYDGDCGGNVMAKTAIKGRQCE